MARAASATVAARQKKALFVKKPVGKRASSRDGSDLLPLYGVAGVAREVQRKTI